MTDQSIYPHTRVPENEINTDDEDEEKREEDQIFVNTRVPRDE